ncbi:MAG: hypothetical protein PVF70_14085, partial [Anaerolineales bacterium]
MTKARSLSVLTALVLLGTLFLTIPAGAGGPAPPSGLTPVDIDPYYKELTGEAAASLIDAETDIASAELAQASQESAAYVGVGDVEFLYADGWREFTLRAIGGNAEVWVANDLSYCPGDPRPPHEITQDQVDYIFDQFNNVIYPSNTNYFGFTNDRDGTGGLFASWGYDWYETTNPQ